MNAFSASVRHEPRWPAIVAVLAIGGLYMALPDSLAVGPRWLAPAIVLALLVPGIITHHMGWGRANHLLGVLLSGAITLFMVWSLALLVRALPSHKEPAVTMLRSAAALWWTNVLVFAVWYWRLDAGGPRLRSGRPHHESGAFLFPQMQFAQSSPLLSGKPWSPRFIDYLFLAFNTSTALSPTDAPILSRWAKVLVMTQASISLTVIAILLGRAINIL
ncbi:MAG TPA: hypothetical protein VFC78_07010 [Tepidisphaeraceae bacterium]|nr:hypothetical protein [Tepidisphaeraceae bacterium]